MTKLLFVLLLFGSPVMAEPESWPTYCIRSVTSNGDGTAMLDFPGWPYGMNDSPIRVKEPVIDRFLQSDYCTPDDPRMTDEYL
jgi:hypothetical protein